MSRIDNYAGVRRMFARALFAMCGVLSSFCVQAAAVVYTNNFETADTTGWTVIGDSPKTVASPSGRKFLGEYASNTSAQLTLSALPSHTEITVSFDLYILKSWDGNDYGPDRWFFALDDIRKVDATFANVWTQTYPAWFGTGQRNSPHAGAAEVNTLGYGNYGDSVYRFSFKVPHTASSVNLLFGGTGLGGVTDESWGIDNVQVSVDSSTSLAVYDAGRTPSNPQNPNGAWTYGYTKLMSPYAYAPFTTRYVDPANPKAERWSPEVAYGAASPIFGWLAAYRNGTNLLTFHPGRSSSPSQYYSVLRFTAPTTGAYLIESTAYAGDVGETDFRIIRNESVSNSLFYASSTTVNPTYSGTVNLIAGELLDFIVGPSGPDFNDSTPVALRISSSSVPDTQAPTISLDAAAQIDNDKVEFRYTATDAGGIKRVPLQVSSNADFSGTLLLESDLALTGVDSRTLTERDVPLYARVAAVDSSNNTSAWSPPLSFTVVAPPVAAFQPSVLAGEAPVLVSFVDQSTGPVTSYQWAFGDGTTSTEQSPQYVYRTPGTYTVTLTVRGISGQATTTHTITVAPDITPPIVTELSKGGVAFPNGAILTDNTSLTVKVTDSSGVTGVVAQLNGANLPVSANGNGVFTVTLNVQSLPNGDYTLLIRALDTAGNVVETARQITLAIPLPSAPTFTAPVANLKTNQATVSVAGTSPTGTAVRLYVNGVVSGDWQNFTGGNFTGTVNLTEGTNDITAEVRDLRGTSPLSIARSVVLDTAVPTVVLTPVTQVGANQVKFAYNATDAGSGITKIRLQVADVADFSHQVIAESDLSLTGQDTRTINLPSAPLYARVSAIDAAGNQSAWTAAQTFTIAPPPTAAFSFTPSTGRAPLAVQFTDQSVGTVSSYQWVFGGGIPNATVANPLVTYKTPGTYTVNLTVTGSTGSATTAHTLTVLADATAPVITEISTGGAAILDGATLTGNTTITVKVTDASGVAGVIASLNGNSLPVLAIGNGEFAVTLNVQTLTNGNYGLSIRATDTSGNAVETLRTLTVAVPPPPPPTLTAPAANLKTNQATVAVSGTSPTGTAVRLYVNGIISGDWQSFTGGSFTGNVGLTEGTNAITAEIRDVHGTSVQSSARSVTLDSNRPPTATGLVATSVAAGRST